MKTSWVVALWILFVGASLLSGILEMQFLSGTGGQEAGVLTRLMTIPSLKDLDFFSAAIAIVSIPFTWLLAFWDMIMWNYAFFTGSWALAKWFLCYPLSAAVVVSIIMTIRGTSSA